MRSWIRCILVVFTSSWLASAQLALAQESIVSSGTRQGEASDQQLHRPTIGLVLEGGGALGLAHVGVLRWFEEHHVPVDFVAGTSMGGLVGGLYATGESATEMVETVKEIDWNKALSNETPYRELSFRRKEDASAFPSTIEFGLKGGISFPSGLISGHQVGLILDRIAMPYSQLKSFDDLPTPFRCVATDLVSNRAVVFDRGSLATALRATMSLPGIFAPVRRDDQVEVDGGLLKNLPVDVARAMGADIVIAVHLESKPLNPETRLSTLGVLKQSVATVIAANELASMERADILIPVNPQNYTSTSYDAADQLMELGYQGAQERAKVLERFSVSDAEWSEYIERRKRRMRPVPVPQFIDVTGVPPVLAEGLEKSLADEVGQPIHPERLDRELTTITGLGRYSWVGYQLVRQNGREELLIHAEEKDYAPPLVKPLFIINGSDYNNILFSLGARITFLDLGGFGSELRNDVVVGSDYVLRSEFYHLLSSKDRWFVAPRVFATNVPFDLYFSDTRIASYREGNLGVGGDLGIAIDRFSELRFGYQIGRINLRREIGVQELPSGSGRQSFSRIQFITDYRDNPIVPRDGYYVKYGFRVYDANLRATKTYPWMELQGSIFKPISRPGSVFLKASGGTTFGFNLTDTGLPAFSLGGPTDLAGYGINELLTNQYFLVQPGYLHQIKQLSPLLGGGSISAFGIYEVAKVYGSLNASLEPRVPQDFNAGIIIQTPLGPIVVGGAIGGTKHSKFYFQLGKFF